MDCDTVASALELREAMQADARSSIVVYVCRLLGSVAPLS